MALKYRVRKLNGSGTYDTLHFETESSLTLRPDGSTTVEASLATLESNSHAPASATLGTAADAPAFGETLSVVKSISTNANGHVTGVVTDTITFPALPSYLAYLSTITSDAQSQIDGKAPINSPSFTGIPKAPTTAAGDNSTAIATTAYVDGMVNAVLAAADAVCLKGTISGGDTLPTADAGWVYRVLSNGTISGFTAYTGDTITCFVDGTPANTPANWFITHNNDGSGVIGPLSSVDSHVAVFNGTTGKVLKDSGFTIGASVPAGAKFTDTVYTHPATHDISMIIDSSSDNVFTGDNKMNGLLYFKNNTITNISAVYNSGFYGTKNTDATTPYTGYWFVAVFCKDPVNQIAVQWAMNVGKTHNGELWIRTVRLNAASTGDGNMVGEWCQILNTQLADTMYAKIVSPALTGIPTAPTAAVGTNTTQIATTAFVQAAISAAGGGIDIRVAGSQPADQSANDWWCESLA